MSNHRPLFGETTDREKAFPGIKALSIIVKQNPYGDYITNDYQREASYSKTNLPRYATCYNPTCQQGGIDLQNIVLYAKNGEKSYPCNGHEGSPKGVRRGDSCDNVFNIIVEIDRE